PLRAEQHSRLTAAHHVVVADEVVRVAVADRDAVTAAVLDHVLLGHGGPHPPAEEQADVVAPQPVAPDDRPLRAGPRVQAQAGVVVAVAALHDDVVADLPADAVAVVLAGRDLPQGHAVAVLQEDAAGVVAVEVLVVLPVAVEGDVLNDDVGDT